MIFIINYRVNGQCSSNIFSAYLRWEVVGACEYPPLLCLSCSCIQALSGESRVAQFVTLTFLTP